LIRRRATSVSGEVALDDGTTREIDERTMLAPLERALRSLSWSTIAFATALALTRLT
jgi:hypothetical protein